MWYVQVTIFEKCVCTLDIPYICRLKNTMKQILTCEESGSIKWWRRFRKCWMDCVDQDLHTTDKYHCRDNKEWI